MLEQRQRPFLIAILVVLFVGAPIALVLHSAVVLIAMVVALFGLVWVADNI